SPTITFRWHEDSAFQVLYTGRRNSLHRRRALAAFFPTSRPEPFNLFSGIRPFQSPGRQNARTAKLVPYFWKRASETFAGAERNAAIGSIPMRRGPGAAGGRRGRMA